MRRAVTDSEWKDFNMFMKAWSRIKMAKLERKLRKYAQMYYGVPVIVLYAWNISEKEKEKIKNGTKRLCEEDKRKRV